MNAMQSDGKKEDSPLHHFLPGRKHPADSPLHHFSPGSSRIALAKSQEAAPASDIRSSNTPLDDTSADSPPFHPILSTWSSCMRLPRRMEACQEGSHELLRILHRRFWKILRPRVKTLEMTLDQIEERRLRREDWAVYDVKSDVLEGKIIE